MKFVSLTTKRAHRQRKLEEPCRAALESSVKPTPPHDQIHTYAELRQQIHEDLRVQHPEWVEPDGKSPRCDSYEMRLAELLSRLTPREHIKCIVDPHRLLEQRTN